MRTRSLAVPLLFVALVLAACSHNTRTTTLRASLTALDVVADTVVEVSAKRQEQIANTAPSADEAHAQLASFRVMREPVVEAVALAYKAIATAALGDADLAKTQATVRDAIDRAKEWLK